MIRMQDTAILALAFSIGAAAQEPGQRIRIKGVAVGAEPATFNFIGAEGFAGGKVVAGAPYSADGHTEFTQVLGDGTRISRKNVSSFARDSQGRTRTEQTLRHIGPWASSGDAQRIVTIHDPVAKETIILNENDKTARRLRMPEPGGPPPGAFMFQSEDGKQVRVEREVRVIRRGEGKEDVLIETAPVAAVHAAPMMGDRVMFFGGKDAKSEDLGKQTIESVVCEGKRTTHTIPVGEMGNDRPITITSERWYSPELQVVVMSRTTDPMHGDTAYRLTNVKRGEQPSGAFQVPSGYTLTDAPPPMRFERRMEKKQ